jgi:hypothetical protein
MVADEVATLGEAVASGGAVACTAAVGGRGSADGWGVAGTAAER